MLTLHRKLWRDLADMKGQVAAIAVVIAAGVMTLIIAVSSLDSIRLSKERFYTSHEFADLFVSLTRAPDHLQASLANIPGVARAETRVVAPLRLAVDGDERPIRGLMISLPEGQQPMLNRLSLVSGRLPDSGRSDEVVVSASFAEAHGLEPGDRFRAIIRGREQALTLSGTALSPEFVYQVAPGDLLPDYERFAVVWMNRRALANAFAMDGAFNAALFRLQDDAVAASVIEQIDLLLARYGGLGAHDRHDVISHRMLSEEIAQLRVTAVVLPALFLGVSAFLLSVLMGRIVTTQRQQIAVIKAFGYHDHELALHYALLTLLMVAIGVALGGGLGWWASDAMARLYADYFRFPETVTRIQPRVIGLGLLVSLLAAGLGTWRAVVAAVRLAPAEAMRPPPPPVFQSGWLDRSRLGRWLAQTTRIALRNLLRHPLKSGLTALGVGLSGALLLLGSYQFGAVSHVIDLQYRLVMTMDTHVQFSEPTPLRVREEIAALPGVLAIETYRQAPVRLSHGRRTERTALLGLEPDGPLRGLVDRQERPIRLPDEGLFMTRFLADQLELQVGDPVEIQLLDGAQRELTLPLAGVFDEPFGVSAYMAREALNTLLREGPAVSGAWLLTDPEQRDALQQRLWEAPRVAGIGRIGAGEDGISDYLDDTVLSLMGILLLLAGSIAFALVYNNARIAFAERMRELATLRVLGFGRWQVAWVLIAEVVVLTLLALPLGFAFGTLFAWLLSLAFSMDMLRVPFHITPFSYAFSAAGVIAAASLSVLMIARRLYRLDMVSSLKSVE
ncbi:MAG: ABC transporter permease [Wenzhouxiangella sp.]